MLKKYLSKIVKEVIESEFHAQRETMKEEVASALHDVSYRINVMKESAYGGKRGETRIHTQDLNLATHMIDGYVFTNNSPVAGSVAWTDLKITYKGVTYAITNGNSANKFIWFDFDATNNLVLVSNNTKPTTLTVDDILIGVNDAGVFTPTFVNGQMGHASALKDGTVGSNELGSAAVTAGKIAASAINNSNLFSGKVLTGGNMVDGTVSSTQLGANAVIDTKIADNAVTTTKLNGGAVTEAKLGTGSVTSTKLGAGSVAEDKLNVATHFIF